MKLVVTLPYGQRLSPVSAMIDGDWQQAIPTLYEEMQRTLEAWTTPTTLQ